MPLYKYKAEKPTGEVYERKRIAADKATLYQEVRSEGDSVLYADLVADRKAFWGSALSSLLFRVPTREKILFARNLGSMLHAGLPLSRALSVIERQNKKKVVKDVVSKISTQVNQGKSLSEALQDFPGVFSSLFISMVKAGEESGSLPTSLQNIAGQMDRTYQLQKKIQGAMIYPAVIIVVIIAIAIIMMIYVVPTLSSVFKELDVDLPWNTRLVIFLSDWIQHNIVIFLTSVVGVALAVWMFQKSSAGRKFFDFALLHLPVIKNIAKEANSARTARTLASLLSAGVEVVQSMEIVIEVVQNSYFKKVLEKVKEQIKKGEPMSSVFAQHSNLYPVFVGEMVSIGEETGKLGEMLGNIADYYENEVEQRTKDLSTIIEPVLMIVVGAAVAFFALAMLSPTYTLVDKI